MLLITQIAVSNTRVWGVAAYGLAALASFAALVRARLRKRASGLPFSLLLLNVLLIADQFTDFRWMVYRQLRRAAESLQLYERRGGAQAACLLVLAGLLAAALTFGWGKLRGRPFAKVALAGGLLSGCWWVMEIISLHQVDSLLYRQLDSGMLWVTFLWIFSGAMTCLGLLLDRG